MWLWPSYWLPYLSRFPATQAWWWGLLATGTPLYCCISSDTSDWESESSWCPWWFLCACSTLSHGVATDEEALNVELRYLRSNDVHAQPNPTFTFFVDKNITDSDCLLTNSLHGLELDDWLLLPFDLKVHEWLYKPTLFFYKSYGLLFYFLSIFYMGNRRQSYLDFLENAIQIVI